MCSPRSLCALLSCLLCHRLLNLFALFYQKSCLSGDFLLKAGEVPKEVIGEVMGIVNIVRWNRHQTAAGGRVSGVADCDCVVCRSHAGSLCPVWDRLPLEFLVCVVSSVFIATSVDEEG